MGMTMDADTMKTFGIDVSDFYIKINGDKATINVMGSGGDCDVKIDGSSITFSSSTQTISGTYDSGAGTITVEAGGATMVFKK